MQENSQTQVICKEFWVTWISPVKPHHETSASWIFLVLSRTVTAIALLVSLVPRSLSTAVFIGHTKDGCNEKFHPRSAPRSAREGIYFNCLIIFPHTSEVITRSYGQAGCGISAFPAFSSECIKCVPEKTFAVIWLLLRMMLSWSTHSISPILRDRSCLVLSIHPPSTMTDRSTCN